MESGRETAVPGSGSRRSGASAHAWSRSPGSSEDCECFDTRRPKSMRRKFWNSASASAQSNAAGSLRCAPAGHRTTTPHPGADSDPARAGADRTAPASWARRAWIDVFSSAQTIKWPYRASAFGSGTVHLRERRKVMQGDLVAIDEDRFEVRAGIEQCTSAKGTDAGAIELVSSPASAGKANWEVTTHVAQDGARRETGVGRPRASACNPWRPSCRAVFEAL